MEIAEIDDVLVGDDDEAVRLPLGRWSTHSRHDLSFGKNQRDKLLIR
jgi:hypothetical protein